MTHKKHLNRLLQTDKLEELLKELLDATAQNGQNTLYSNLTIQAEAYYTNENQKEKAVISEELYTHTRNQIHATLALLLKQYKEDIQHTSAKNFFSPTAGAEPEMEERDIAEAAPPNKGVLLHCIPPKMQTHNLHRCIIRVAFDKETILADLPNWASTPVLKENIRVTDKMEVSFSPNEHFEITALNAPIQIVEQDSLTEWNFDVRPLSLGKFPLSFKVSIILSNGVKELILTESVMVVTERVEAAMEFIPVDLQEISPKMQALDTFRAELHKILDDKGFVGVNEVLQKIEKSPFFYVKSTLANLRDQIINPLTQLAPNNFIVGLRAFIDGIVIETTSLH